MKLITRDTDYALRALCYIAKKEKKVVSISELVEQLRMPRPFLRKALQILNKKGILHSYKGSGGGFVLSRGTQDISLLGLIEIFQGPLSLNECSFKRKECPEQRKCPLRRKIGLLEKYIISELRNISVASLLAKARA